MAAGVDSRAVLARLDSRVPPELAEGASEFVARGAPPVAPRLSASVLLIREASSADPALEVYVMHRHPRMPFAPGFVAFPGGGADPGEGPVEAAVRETREETGVRLAPDALRPWAHWITPACEPRRYDTHFFLATLPAGQQAADVSGETVRAGWAKPSAVLDEADAGVVTLMPPTRSMLLELADCASVAEAVGNAVGRRVQPVLPELLATDRGWRFHYGAGET
ncbi:MAG: NUDIX hydrolase [Propionibacteriales bacterium]|nr:NUDIX hydrolase [Propionibacteriales bacterium]